MKIKILSDSTCDLSKELVEKYDITIIPLTVIKDGQNYRDCVDITTADIFAHVAGGGSLCSTAALNIEEYTDAKIMYCPIGFDISTYYCVSDEEHTKYLAEQEAKAREEENNRQ